MDICTKLGIELLWRVGGGKIQSSSTLVNDAGMAPGEGIVCENGIDLTPSRVDVIASGDIPKNSDY